MYVRWSIIVDICRYVWRYEGSPKFQKPMTTSHTTPEFDIDGFRHDVREVQTLRCRRPHCRNDDGLVVPPPASYYEYDAPISSSVSLHYLTARRSRGALDVLVPLLFTPQCRCKPRNDSTVTPTTTWPQCFFNSFVFVYSGYYYYYPSLDGRRFNGIIGSYPFYRVSKLGLTFIPDDH